MVKAPSTEPNKILDSLEAVVEIILSPGHKSYYARAFLFAVCLAALLLPPLTLKVWLGSALTLVLVVPLLFLVIYSFSLGLQSHVAYRRATSVGTATGSLSLVGPLPFREDQHELYLRLGRREAVGNLLSLVMNESVPIVYLHGPSGAGKTSLLRGGLVPQLRNSGLEYVFWEATSSRPFTSFCRASGLDVSNGDLAGALTREASKCAGQVILIDQLEQLIPEDPQHEQFFQLISKTTKAGSPYSLRWVLAFSDTYASRWVDWEKQQEHLHHKTEQVRLDNFSTDQAINVYLQLVKDSGLSIDAFVVEQLARDLADKGKVSPALIGTSLLSISGVLDSSKAKNFGRSQYRKLGGYQGHLETYLESQLEKILPADQPNARRILHSLCDKQKVLRAPPKRVAEISSDTGLKEETAGNVVRALSSRNIQLVKKVSGPGGLEFQLAHDLMVRAFVGYLQKRKPQASRLSSEIAGAHHKWERSGRQRRDLLGVWSLWRLRRAARKGFVSSFGADIEGFLKRSRSRSLIRLALAGVVFVLVGCCGYFVWQMNLGDNLVQWGLPRDLPLRQAQLQRLAVDGAFPGGLWLRGGPKDLDLGAGQLSISYIPRVVEDLDLTGTALSDVKGLDKLSALKYLKLSQTSVSNISALRGHQNLIHLELDGNQRLRNLEGVADLPSLYSLKLDGFKGLGLGGVSKLPSVNWVSIQNSSIKSLSGLNSLESLENIVVHYCRSLRELGSLEGLINLKKLSVTSSKVDDLGPVRALVSLETLRLQEAPRIVNLRGLEGMPLEELDVSSSGLRSVEALEGMEGLERLYLNGNVKLTGADGLEGMPRLSEISLFGTGLNDISGLRHLPALRQLNLSRTADLRDIAPLGRFGGSLTKLWLRGTGVVDFSPLANLRFLMSLDLSALSLDAEQAAVLAELPSLSLLVLEDMLDFDWGVLSQLKFIRHLDIGGNSNIKHIMSLVGFRRELERLILSNTDITDADPLSGYPSLEELVLANTARLRTLRSLEKLPALKVLRLSSCGLRNIGEGPVLASVREIFMDGCSSLSTILDMGRFPGAKEIDLSGTESLRSLEGVGGARSLEILKVENSSIENFVGVSDLQYLEDIHASGNTDLRSLRGLEGHQSVKKVDVEGAFNLRALQGLRDLPRLQSLNLSASGLRTLLGATGVSGVKTLDLGGCVELETLDGIGEFTGLEKLDISGTGISDLAPLRSLNHLEKLVVGRYHVVNLGPLPESVTTLEFR